MFRSLKYNPNKFEMTEFKYVVDHMIIDDAYLNFL